MEKTVGKSASRRGKHSGDVGIEFKAGTTDEVLNQVNQFAQACLERSSHSAISEESMVSLGYVTQEGSNCMKCVKCNHQTGRIDHMRQHLASHYKELCYKCQYCDATCTTKSHFKIHIRKHTGVASHRCSQCQFSTFTKNGLQRHIEHMHSKLIKYICPVCRKPFSSSKELQTHTASCDMILGCSEGVKCRSECGYKCETQKKMIEHMKLSHGVDGFSCKICPVVLIDKEALKTHAKLHKTYLCINCEFSTTFKHRLIKHYFKSHGKTREHICNFCNKNYSSKSELTQHENDHICQPKSGGDGSNILTRYRCLLCEYITPYKTKNLLKNHMLRVHSFEKPISCHHCSYRCKEEGQLKLHMRVHSNTQPYLCQLCGFRCKWPSQMKLHQAHHTGIKSRKCKLCSYESYRSDTLATHMKHKHGVACSILCEQCGYVAASKTAFRTHRNVHSNDRPFICQECEKGFKTSANLHAHSKRVHCESKSKYNENNTSPAGRQGQMIPIENMQNHGMEYSEKFPDFVQEKQFSTPSPIQFPSMSFTELAAVNPPHLQPTYNETAHLSYNGFNYHQPNAATGFDGNTVHVTPNCEVEMQLETLTSLPTSDIAESNYWSSCHIPNTETVFHAEKSMTPEAINPCLIPNSRDDREMNNLRGRHTKCINTSKNVFQESLLLQNQHTNAAATEADVSEGDVDGSIVDFNIGADSPGSDNESFAKYVSTCPTPENQNPPMKSSGKVKDFCDDSTKLGSHSSTNQPEPVLTGCLLCSHQASSNDALYHHMRRKHKQDSYTCTDCTHTSKFISQYVVHRCSHMGINLFPCPVETCNYIGFTNKHLLMHSRVHSESRNYKCTECNFTSKYAHRLKLHQLQHSGNRKFQCKLCSYKCFRADLLRRHEASKHSSDKPYSCTICGYSAKMRTTLVKHQIKHKQERLWTCETCGKSFKSRAVLLIHNRVHVVSLRCPHCKFRCDEMTNYECHIEKHLSKYASAKYRCSNCPYGTNNQRNLYEHNRTKHKDSARARS